MLYLFDICQIDGTAKSTVKVKLGYIIVRSKA